MTRAERRVEQQTRRAAELARRLDALLALQGAERVLDVGCGTGALAHALAPRVREVVAVDSDAAMVAVARGHAPANVRVEQGDGERLPFEAGAFDLGGTLLTLHHTKQPQLLLAELARVTRPGGTVLVVDQLAPQDGDRARALNEFERARDTSTSRVLSERELRELVERLGLLVERSEIVRERRDLDAYLDLAGCEGAERERAFRLAPPGYEATVGWFVLSRP